jgi:hypothetical protein
VSKSRSFAHPSFKPLIHFHITPSLPYFPIPTPPVLIVGPHLLRILLKQYPFSFYSECSQLLDLRYTTAEDSDSVFSLQCLCHNKLAKTMTQSSTKPPLRESAPSPTPTEPMNMSKVSRSLLSLHHLQRQRRPTSALLLNLLLAMRHFTIQSDGIFTTVPSKSSQSISNPN